MALNIKDKETEALVTEIAALTGETKTGAVRQAARERLKRLRLEAGDPRRDAESMRRWLETEIWPLVPADLRGKSISKPNAKRSSGTGPTGCDLDSSAVVAVLLGEPGHEGLEAKMRGTELLGIGAPTLFETEMVMSGARRESGRSVVTRFRESLGLAVVSFSGRHCDVATEAFLRFGKGRHPAALNYGDCMTYAIARVAQRPLLYIGNDFGQTDIEAA